jgi:hypothetical protein
MWRPSCSPSARRGQKSSPARENPFYVEAGGQVSDTGIVEGQGWDLPVDLVRKDPRGTVIAGTFGRSSSRPPAAPGLTRPPPQHRETTAPLTWFTQRYANVWNPRPPAGFSGGRESPRFDFSHHGPINSEMLRDHRTGGERPDLGQPPRDHAAHEPIPTHSLWGRWLSFRRSTGMS